MILFTNVFGAGFVGGYEICVEGGDAEEEYTYQ